MSDTTDDETYGFTLNIEKKIVAMMLFDRGTFLTNINIVKPESFDSPVLGDMIRIIIAFFKKYSRVPTKDEFLEELDIFLEGKKGLPSDEYLDVAIEVLGIGEEGDFEYVGDKVVDFARYQGVKKEIMEAGEKRLEKRDYEGIVLGIRKAIAIGEDKEDLGTFIHRDLEERLELRRTIYNRALLGIPTGISTIDFKLGSGGKPGGICPQEVGVIMSPTKRGKTTVAANFTKAPLNKGLHVVHYSFESNIRATEEIYDAMVTDIPKHDLVEREEEVRQEYNAFFEREGIGELVIKHFPAGGTPWMIEAHLHQLKAQGIDPSLLIVDYIGLMKTADKGVRYEGSSSGRYLMFGQITLELINLAQRGNYAIWLLHQSKGYTKKRYADGGRISTEDAADSQEIMRHVDLILSLNQTDEEIAMKPQQMRIHAAAGRNVDDAWEVLCEYDKTKAIIREIQTKV